MPFLPFVLLRVFNWAIGPGYKGHLFHLFFAPPPPPYTINVSVEDEAFHHLYPVAMWEEGRLIGDIDRCLQFCMDKNTKLTQEATHIMPNYFRSISADLYSQFPVLYRTFE